MPFNPPFLLGIDVGTSGCKTEIFDSSLNSLGYIYQEYNIISRRRGWAEEDAEGWWRVVKDTVRKVLNKSKINPEDVSGISVSCTNACVPVDKDGKALMNAIMQIDFRAAAQAERMKKELGEERVFKITGNRVAPGTFTAPTILWIKENRPKIFEKAYKFLTPTGFIVNKLTGEFTMDWSRCSTTLLFEMSGRKVWSQDLCEELDIPVSKLPTPYSSVEVVGEVTKSACKETGVAEGTPVVAGCMDTVAASIGSGVITPKRLFYVLGSVGRICYCLDEPSFDNRFLNSCHAVEGLWLAIGLMYTSGLSLRWFKDSLGHIEVIRAKKEGVNAYILFDEEAKKSPPGANDLVFLPYLAGERSPIWDYEAKGMLFGLTLRHRRGDVLRAIEEGVAFSLRDNIELVEKILNIKFDSIVVSGGGAKSRFWLQVISDVTGKSLHVLSKTSTEPLGDAVIAGVGSKIFKDLKVTQDKIGSESIVNPRKKYCSRYSHLFNIYRRLYRDGRGSFRAINSLTV